MSGSRKRDYAWGVPREHIYEGKTLPRFLKYRYDIGRVELAAALGRKLSTYHERIKEDDFPNEIECRQIADHLGAERGFTKLDLCVWYGLVTQAEMEEQLQHDPFLMGVGPRM